MRPYGTHRTTERLTGSVPDMPIGRLCHRGRQWPDLLSFPIRAPRGLPARDPAGPLASDHAGGRRATPDTERQGNTRAGRDRRILRRRSRGHRQAHIHPASVSKVGGGDLRTTPHSYDHHHRPLISLHTRIRLLCPRRPGTRTLTAVRSVSTQETAIRQESKTPGLESERLNDHAFSSHFDHCLEDAEHPIKRCRFNASTRRHSKKIFTRR